MEEILAHMGVVEITVVSAALALLILALAEIGAYFWCKWSGDTDPFDMP